MLLRRSLQGVVVVWSVSLPIVDVYGQLVLCNRRPLSRCRHLQVHRIQRVSQSIDGLLDGWIREGWIVDQCITGWMDGWMYEWVH